MKKKIIRSTADIPIDPERPDTLLIFSSHRGSTLQYAKWLVEDLNCDVMPYTRQRLGYSILYRNVIFLSWVRAGEIVRLKLLRQFADTFLLPEKKVEKAEEPENKLPTSAGSSKKQESSRKTSISALLTMP